MRAFFLISYKKYLFSPHWQHKCPTYLGAPSSLTLILKEEYLLKQRKKPRTGARLQEKPSHQKPLQLLWFDNFQNNLHIFISCIICLCEFLLLCLFLFPHEFTYNPIILLICHIISPCKRMHVHILFICSLFCPSRYLMNHSLFFYHRIDVLQFCHNILQLLQISPAEIYIYDQLLILLL